MQFDPYSTTSDNYDLDEFYTRSVDKRGHHSSAYISIPPELSAEIQEMVASKSFPAYRTAGHFWRDASIHRLHYLAQRGENPRLARFIRLQVHLANAEALLAEQRQHADLLEKFGTAMEQAHERGDNQALGRISQAVVLAAEDVPDTVAEALLKMVNRYAT